MIRLETVEDFEKAKKALNDSNSIPEEYCIKVFGYCSFCEELTEYANCGMFYSQILCLTCLKIFRAPHLGEDHKYYLSPEYGCYYTRGQGVPIVKEDKIPQEFRFGFYMSNTREYQIKLFNNKREVFIKELKKSIRTANNNIRRLAKLR